MNKLKFHAGFIPDILSGRKTQTRRPINPQPVGGIGRYTEDGVPGESGWCAIDDDGDPTDELIECPYPPGVYEVNESLSVVVTSVRVERLQSISEKDACADGAFSPLTLDYKKPRVMVIWEAFYGNSEFSWVNNPWVWVLEFRKVANE